MRIRVRLIVALAVFALPASVVNAAEINVADAPSLTAALATAESNGEDNVINLSPAVYEGHFEYVSKDARSLTIRAVEGAAPYTVILDGASTGRILNSHRDVDRPHRYSGADDSCRPIRCYKAELIQSRIHWRRLFDRVRDHTRREDG